MARPHDGTARRVAARLLAWALLLAAGAAAAAEAAQLRLHVPSPDWRDQILYFALTDRFDDGDTSNNDQGAGEYRPGSKAHYQGGDLAGLTRRLDYIRGLGATGLWITPPVANQWWDPWAGYSGYHGYWAEHFGQVDKHLGTLDDYRRLSHALHSVGMVLVQDIVVNHTGNFFRYRDGWSASDPAADWQPNTGSLPAARPSQPPFDRNDPRDAAQRRDAIYHWTPDVRDYTRRQQVLDWQMSGLDDLNTGNPAVRRALRQSYGHWIREVGVDAFRVDTAFYVPERYFDDFLHAGDPLAPGVARVARQTGRRDFFVFGEGFAIDKPFQTTAAARVERYATAPDGRARLPGMLNFPLYGSLGAVLARGAPPAELGHRITAMMRLHRDPHRMPSFVDNHDVDRFLAGGSEAGLRQALLAIMTLPGIPVIYYGTEQGFTAPRAAMFAAGHGSGGRDHFDTDAPLYRLIRQMSDLRRGHPVFTRGVPRVLQADAAVPGVLAWRMQHGRDAALVVLNTADAPTLLSRLPTGAAPGSRLAGLFSLDGTAVETQVDAHGALTAVLPPRSGQVWRLPPAQPALAAAVPGAATPQAAAGRRPTITALQLADDGDSALASGRAAPDATLQLVLDGQLASATATRADRQGRWQARMDTRALVDGRTPHRLVAWLPAERLASAPRRLVARRQWQLLVDQADPAGDDHGTDGRTTYPTDPTWGANRQMDLRRLRVWRAGGALRIALDMHRVTQSWAPQNGFDHVAFTLFFGLPGRDDGQSVMPLQDAALPEGMRWHYRLRAHGWSNAWFAAAGASADAEGLASAPGAQVEVDAARHTVLFTLPAGALGDAAALRGLKVYVTTWDWDGGYRALQPQAGGHAMGGGPGPKVMDAMGPVTLP